jgi:lipid-binding SYLF domain-containing protein
MFRKLSLLAISLLMTTQLIAKSASVIEAEANVALAIFKTKPGATKFLSQVKGYLIFPSVIKGGFIVGGEYGEGVLKVNGQTRGYYSIGSGSLGFQAGIQEASYLIAFVSQRALNNFIKSNGWEVGVDGTITFITWGVGKDISSISYEKPIYGFVFNSKGLMGGVSLEGTKFTRINPR